MAGHAELVGKTLLVKDPADLVGLMAVDTARDLMGLFLPKLTPDHLQMNLFNLSVALHAGGRNVGPVNRRCRVLVRENVM